MPLGVDSGRSLCYQSKVAAKILTNWFSREREKMLKTDNFLRTTMKEELLYNATKRILRERHGIEIPAYVEGSYFFDETCCAQIKALPLEAQGNAMFDAIAEAHDQWRTSLSVAEAILHWDNYERLNIFARIELAGPEIYILWAQMFFKMFAFAGFAFEQAYQEVGYTKQLAWIAEKQRRIDSGLLDSAFVIRRRRFVEQTIADGQDFADKGDILKYVMSEKNDVLALYALIQRCPAAMSVAKRIKEALYEGYRNLALAYCPRPEMGETTNITFPLTREIIDAGGGVAPIEW